MNLYAHIPFCEQRCHYCAFAVSTRSADHYGPYVDRLVREIELARVQVLPGTLYLGGGTPSLLGPELIRKVGMAIGSCGDEFTIEANPGTLDPDRMEAWRELGVNRVSLGAQSFDAEDLERAGRLHTVADTIEDYEQLCRFGFGNINLDLIAGLPGQEKRRWLENLEWIERLAPDHVSIYLLELDDSAVWAVNPPQSGRDSDLAWFYQAASDRLEAAGYTHYEVSSWARPGKECRHNMGYWTGEAYRGVGLGAHSFEGKRRFWNTRSMTSYAEMLDQGRLPNEGSESLTPTMRVQEVFLLGLRQMSGFDVRPIAEDLGFEYPLEWFERVEDLESAGLVCFDGSTLRLTSSAWLLTSSITTELLCPSLLSICEAIP